jgi:hypothetical protein
MSLDLSYEKQKSEMMFHGNGDMPCPRKLSARHLGSRGYRDSKENWHVLSTTRRSDIISMA